MFRKITDAYCENHSKHINTLCVKNAQIYKHKHEYCITKSRRQTAGRCRPGGNKIRPLISR